MNTKYISDQDFKKNGNCFVVTIYPTKKDYNNEWNGHDIMTICNNHMNKGDAMHLVMGAVASARLRWSYPVAVLYYHQKDGGKIELTKMAY